jgi:hypothetical protein
MCNTWRGGLGCSFRMGEEGAFVDINYNEKTSIGQWTVGQHQSLKTQHFADVCLTSMPMPNMLLSEALSNIVVVCKSHYIDWLIKKLGIGNSLCASTCTMTTLPRETIIVGLHWWRWKMQNCMYLHSTGIIIYTRILTNSIKLLGLPKCSIEPLNKLFSLSAVKTGLQSYCGTSYSKGGVNQMWILSFRVTVTLATQRVV